METMAARKKKATILLENIKGEYETAMQDIQAEMTEGTPNAASAEWVRIYNKNHPDEEYNKNADRKNKIWYVG